MYVSFLISMYIFTVSYAFDKSMKINIDHVLCS